LLNVKKRGRFKNVFLLVNCYGISNIEGGCLWKRITSLSCLKNVRDVCAAR
jgi:hypothetical protein